MRKLDYKSWKDMANDFRSCHDAIIEKLSLSPANPDLGSSVDLHLLVKDWLHDAGSFYKLHLRLHHVSEFQYEYLEDESIFYILGEVCILWHDNKVLVDLFPSYDIEDPDVSQLLESPRHFICKKVTYSLEVDNA